MGRHHFCFAGFQHPDRLSWGTLHGVNLYHMQPWAERRATFHGGFEIVTIVLAGRWKRTGSLPAAVSLGVNETELVSTGIGTQLGAVTSAGTDVTLLEIWVASGSPNSQPRRQWLARRRTDFARPVATGAPPEIDALMWDAGARLHYGWLENGDRYRSRLENAERAYLVVVDGLVSVNGILAQAGDGVAATGAGRIHIEAIDRARLVWLRGL